MDLQETMRELESLGSEQTRKTFLRHGAPEPLFGVKFGDLEKLRKRIKTNAGLAEALWNSGNSDARMLATMVADAPAMSWAQLDAWARALDWHSLVDVFVKNVALRSPHARQAVETWASETGEMLSRAGWQLLSALSAKTELLADAELAPWLERIEQGIHSAQNRVREAMNTALIAIGGRGGALQEQALAVAQRIGKVEVDHGDTACETPDAAEYIAKVRAHRDGMAGKAAALAQNAVASVKNVASDAAKRAQSVASGAMNAVASARNVVSDAREAVTSATHAVSDVAKSAVASARNVASAAVGKPLGGKNAAPKLNGAAKKVAAKKVSPVTAKKPSVKRATPATVKKAAVKKGAVKRAVPAAAKKPAGKRAAPVSAKKAAAKRATPAAAKKAPARGRSAAKKSARPRA